MNQYVWAQEERMRDSLTQAHSTAALQRSRRLPSLKRLLEGGKGRTRVLPTAEAEKAMRRHLELQRQMNELDRRRPNK